MDKTLVEKIMDILIEHNCDGFVAIAPKDGWLEGDFCFPQAMAKIQNSIDDKNKKISLEDSKEIISDFGRLRHAVVRELADMNEWQGEQNYYLFKQQEGTQK